MSVKDKHKTPGRRPAGTASTGTEPAEASREDIAKLLRALNDDLPPNAADDHGADPLDDDALDDGPERKADRRLPLGMIAAALVAAAGVGFAVVMLDGRGGEDASSVAEAPQVMDEGSQSGGNQGGGPQALIARPDLAPSDPAAPAVLAPPPAMPEAPAPTAPPATAAAPAPQSTPPLAATAPEPPAPAAAAPRSAEAPAAKPADPAPASALAPASPPSPVSAPSPTTAPAADTRQPETATAAGPVAVTAPAPAPAPQPAPPVAEAPAAEPAPPAPAQSAQTQSAQTQSAPVRSGPPPAPPAQTAPPPAAATQPAKPAASPRAPAAAAPAVPAQGNGGRFTIQLGSFQVAENADALVRRLQARGIEAYTLAWTDSEQRNWRVVRVGRYPSSAEAQRAAEDLRSSIGGLNPVVVIGAR
ncbi:SPOR domain-containing protein [Azospirillum sp. SYSU D00513]|uniref:SPOR domain-containing protein n=1 Tax=Azospirillum sp. SYSU D00513 TaxID=2812561 RepID=UPI001A9679AC